MKYLRGKGIRPRGLKKVWKGKIGGGKYWLTGGFKAPRAIATPVSSTNLTHNLLEKMGFRIKQA